MKINIIAAMSKNHVIGQGDTLPWKNMRSDMAFFSKMTMGNVVIMGRKTYLSIPKKFRPLPNRINIVITDNDDCKAIIQSEGAYAINGFNAAIRLAHAVSLEKSEIYIIGGASVYKQALENIEYQYENLYLTHVDLDAFIDHETVFFPELPAEIRKTKEVIQVIQPDERNDFNAEIYRYKLNS